MSKAELKVFLQDTERILLNNKYRRTTIDLKHHLGYEWHKDTKYGKLYINPNNATSKVYSIFGRFDDPVKAKDILTLFGGNIYSGKCNIHTTDKDEAIRQLNHLVQATG